MSRWLPILGATVILLAVVSCGGSQEPETPPPPPPPSDPELVEIAVQCLELLDEYRETDFDTASESELDRQMREAELNEELCDLALRSGYSGPGGEVMAAHLANELRLHSLKAELTLSERFDELAGYCTVLEDIIRLLDSDARALGEALEAAASGRESLSTLDLQTLLSLRDLSQQTLEVSLVNYRGSCR